MVSESSVNDFFVEAADYICEAAYEEDVMLDENVNFDLVVEAVVGLMSDEQLAMENVEDFVMEAALYILNEFKKVKAKKAAEKAEKLAKRAAQSTVAQGVKADDKAHDAAQALIKARKMAKAEGDEKTVEKVKEVGRSLHNVRKDPNKEEFTKSVFAGKGRKVNPNKTEANSQVVKDKLSRRAAKKAAAEAAQKRAESAAAKKAAEIAQKKSADHASTALATIPKASNNDNVSDAAKKTIGDKIAGGAKAAGEWIKNNPGKTAGIAAGTAALTGGAIYAAKKIADKKKAAAAAKEEVKENTEYPEYLELLEAVIGEFTEEEIMAENASEMACAVADILIENEIVAVVDSKGKAKETIGSKVGNFVKNNKKAIGIGAGVAAAGAATAIAAKKIADKKKADKEAGQEVKENAAYEGYETLVENVINHFMSEEEIMSENASQIAIATADYFIEHIDEM